MGLPSITVLADQAGQMQIGRRERKPHLLGGLANTAGMRGFPDIGLELAARRAPQVQIRLLRPFEQQHFIPLIEAVKQSGNFVGQRHARSEAGAGQGDKALNILVSNSR